MVYSSRFVLNVLVNGQIVEARKDGVVAIPFGSEYVIRCRNKHKDRRALVKLYVDGECIGKDGKGGFVIEANSFLDIKRRADVNCALKFTQLTSAEAAEIGKEDNNDGSKGVIEARFHLEKVRKPKTRIPRGRQPKITPLPIPYPYPYPPVMPTSPATPLDDWTWKPGVSPSNPVWIGGGTTDNTLYDGHRVYCSTSEMGTFNSGTVKGALPPTNINNLLDQLRTGLNIPEKTPTIPSRTDKKLEEGCTVDGGVTDQSFVDVQFNAETDFVTLMMVLRGYDADSEAEIGKVSIAPKQEEYCTNCGQKKGRKADRFCGKCGHKF